MWPIPSVRSLKATFDPPDWAPIVFRRGLYQHALEAIARLLFSRIDIRTWHLKWPRAARPVDARHWRPEPSGPQRMAAHSLRMGQCRPSLLVCFHFLDYFLRLRGSAQRPPGTRAASAHFSARFPCWLFNGKRFGRRWACGEYWLRAAGRVGDRLASQAHHVFAEFRANSVLEVRSAATRCQRPPVLFCQARRAARRYENSSGTQCLSAGGRRRSGRGRRTRAAFGPRPQSFSIYRSQ